MPWQVPYTVGLNNQAQPPASRSPLQTTVSDSNMHPLALGFCRHWRSALYCTVASCTCSNLMPRDLRRSMYVVSRSSEAGVCTPGSPRLCRSSSRVMAACRQRPGDELRGELSRRQPASGGRVPAFPGAGRTTQRDVPGLQRWRS